MAAGTQNGNIYVIQDDHHLLKLVETEYDSEEILQNLIDNYPDLLAGEQMNNNNPRKWIPSAREFAIPSSINSSQWRIDHLFIDQDCIPTFIEVKRSTDTRNS